MTEPEPTAESESPAEKRDFIRNRIRDDIASGKVKNVITRFPPEPNGYLHIGHAKAFLLNFGIADEFGGHCNLRFDDTNPSKEEQEYVDAIIEDIRWLGCEPHGEIKYASGYFETLHEWATHLIRKGVAFVDTQSPEEIAAQRGDRSDARKPGQNSPHRDRSVEENLELFEKMRAGGFKEGEAVLRAKIDMSHPNFNMRDPVMVRVMHVHHHRTGDAWCIYPTYDWAHGQGDAIEGVTHSLCSLEFEHHRPLYDWYLDQLADLDVPHPQQIEFARLELTYIITSKRKLRQLVEDKIVSGWDDPRMPTLRGMRRRGYPAEAIRAFILEAGVSRAQSTVDFVRLENAVRDYLNVEAPRAMAVLDPLKVVIENYPEDQTEEFEFPNHPDKPGLGSRKVPFGREIWIERADFMEDPPKKFFRLSVGKEVRLRHAYFITCTGVVKNDAGEIVELRATYDPESRGGQSPDGRKVKGTMHWVSVADAADVEVRVYDHLFRDEAPGKDREFLEDLNPDSLKVVTGKLEPALKDAGPGATFQFERTGYFTVDTVDSKPGAPVFNRTVALKDSWAKQEKGGGGQQKGKKGGGQQKKKEKKPKGDKPKGD